MAQARVRLLLLVTLGCLLAGLFSPLLWKLYLLLRLPFVWKASSVDAVISLQRDGFDLTFAAYESNYTVTDPLIPARLHHVHLGGQLPRAEWSAAREECIKRHPNWEVFLWDDRNASHFVQNRYPHILTMWEGYPYLVQRVDALRYMILHTYGGAILDFDLACKRSMEPLRQFEFVAPAANPVGISIGMMLASPNSSYVGDLVRNLPRYNLRWSFLPYITVMFSTGCHYASTIYTLQANTSPLRILAGPPSIPKLHMLNGYVDTPLFRHLGSSSWHQQDARLIKAFANVDQRISFAVILVVVVGTCWSGVLCVSRVRRCHQGRESWVSLQEGTDAWKRV
ncbi:glycosyl transferase [Aspergillus heteromorphus CBS 117.55]|uniref:Glycosyl transferase n=1 Tax=Aspergillus heteromorphus CBS 117.55 TaxID=1448321 RepID=A0A317VIP6_9EURO|nr:glycosyl transferase [Aspergillus heteromorphus CBS 117.55]PWY73057.1 glycosyl transferase [Aspergillus heteromorphus CBS 117.55]